MSAPTTPAEMADWLDVFAVRQWERDALVSGDSGALDEIVAWMRRQPTDAQKIEALHAMSEATEWAEDVRRYHDPYYGEDLSEEELYFVRLGSSKSAEIAWHEARKALRLLGLPTE